MQLDIQIDGIKRNHRILCGVDVYVEIWDGIIVNWDTVLTQAKFGSGNNNCPGEPIAFCVGTYVLDHDGHRTNTFERGPLPFVPGENSFALGESVRRDADKNQDKHEDASHGAILRLFHAVGERRPLCGSVDFRDLRAQTAVKAAPPGAETPERSLNRLNRVSGRTACRNSPTTDRRPRVRRGEV